MQKLALKPFQAWDIRPTPIVENAGGIDEYIALCIDQAARLVVFNLDFPCFPIPCGTYHFVFQMNVLLQLVLRAELLEVLEELL